MSYGTLNGAQEDRDRENRTQVDLKTQQRITLKLLISVSKHSNLISTGIGWEWSQSIM